MNGVFISYRHNGGFEAAHELAFRLRKDGYKVFFDKTSLREGKFDEKIFDNIKRCTDFVVILNKEVFARTLSDIPIEKDWLRMELAFAIKLKKNIIPVAMPGFEWPSHLPEDIADMMRHNAVPYSLDYHYSYYNRLVEHLNSRRPLKNYLGRFVAVFIVLAVVGGVWYSVYQKLNEPTLVLMGGGSVMDYIRNAYDFDTKNNDYKCIYLPMPSGNAWSQIAEVRSLPDQKINKYPYHLVVLSAGRATGEDFFPKKAVRDKFKNGLGCIDEIQIGEIKMQVAISDANLVGKYVKSGLSFENEPVITVKELVDLLNDPTITVFTTMEESGTYKLYNSLLVSLESPGLDKLPRVEEFRSNQEYDRFTANGTPFVILEAVTYFAEHVDDTVAQRFKIFDVDHNRTVSNDLFVYFIVFKDHGYIVPKVVRKFLQDIEKQVPDDYDERWMKGSGLIRNIVK